MFLLLLLLPLSSCDIHITEFTSFPLASSDWTSSTPITTSDTSMIQCGIQCADKLRKDGSCNAFRFDQGTCQVAKVHIGVDLNTIAETVFSKGGFSVLFHIINRYPGGCCEVVRITADPVLGVDLSGLNSRVMLGIFLCQNITTQKVLSFC